MSPVRPRISAYAKRFNGVFEYIDSRLDDDLSLERLSQVAHFSKFHFHRQFSAYVSVGVFQYAQLMRLRRASRRLLLQGTDKILDIALDAGFESSEAFSRSFKRAFGQTPSSFRREPEWLAWNARFVFLNFTWSTIMDVKIVNFTKTSIATLEHCGPSGHLNETVRAFIDWRRETGLSPVQTSRTFGIPYGNPATVPPEEFRFDACGEVAALVPDNAQGVRNKIIPAGRCAVVRHLGSPDNIDETIYPLYRDWLPNSGEELRDFPLFFHYLSVYPETPEHAWQTDVYLPLK